jgi:hypothetical protein
MENRCFQSLFHPQPEVGEEVGRIVEPGGLGKADEWI